MLKSTYRPAAATLSPDPLPEGWAEHKAPSGHTYYYNAETKQSTYTRPKTEAESSELQIDYGALQPECEVQASLNALDEFNRNSGIAGPKPGHFTGGRSYYEHSRPNKQGDRSKSKVSIPDCAPWVLVKTKYGRRFVHNTETKESLWKFPSEVMMAVIDMDRVEWERKSKKSEDSIQNSTANAQPEQAEPPPDGRKEVEDPYESDEYEEVEVTDDEAETEATTKRPRLENDSADAPPGPVEFDEDDIAYQLAAMEQDDYGEEYSGEDDLEEGLELTAEDSLALFRSLLDENNINPFSTFDSLIDTNTALANAIIADDRWTSLPNMASRRQAFTDWSRDRVAERHAREVNSAGTTKQVDPRVAYLRFLATNASLKLYWPEFKRKFRKEAEMKDFNFPEKEREKLYREYISKLKLGDSVRKKDFVTLLKSTSNDGWNRGTSIHDIPASLEKDLRFYLLRDKQRDELLEAHIATLPDA